MSESDAPSLEDLFERYRREGDLDALGAVFDRTAPPLQALAAHLVRDPVEAEDLVQATFLAAIEGASSFESGRKLEAWLAGILARSAARSRRELLRSIDPERLVERDSVDPLKSAEQAEIAALLAKGIERVPEPYRAVLEMRFLEGRRALDIARAKKRAPGTVRMQILRGLERLRRALPAGLFGALPFGRAPRGLDVLRRTILSRAELAAGATAGPTVAGSASLGSLLSAKAIAAVAATAALLALLWTVERRPAEAAKDASVARLPASEARSSDVGREEAGATVLGGQSARLESRKASATLPTPDPARPAPARGVEEQPAELDLARRTQIVGRVELAEGVEPFGTGVLLASLASQGELEVLERAKCDDEGRFTLHPRSGGEFLLVARNWGVPPVSRRVRAREGAVTDAGTLPLEDGGDALEGVLELPFEADVSLFAVHAMRVDPETGEALFGSMRLSGETVELDEQYAKVRAGGSFRIGGLVPASYDVVVEKDRSPDSVVSHPAARVDPPSSGLVLGEHLGRIEVVVGGAEGNDRVPVHVSEDAELADGVQATLRCGELLRVIADRRVPLFVEASAPGFAPARKELAVAWPVEERVELELRRDEQRATLVVEWTVPEGSTPPPWVTARLSAPGEADRMAFAETGPGRLEFRDLDPGSYRVTLEPRGRSTWEPLASFLLVEPFELELAPGETARRFVTWQLGGGARLAPEGATELPGAGDVRARVLDERAREVAVRFVRRELENGGSRGYVSPASLSTRAASELEPRLLPGSYQLVIGEPGREARVPFVVRAGEIAEVRFALE